MTLTEVTVVFVLSAILMTGLVAFYLNSQMVWTDGSTQAIAQREVTLVLEAITRRARASNGVTVQNTPDARHVTIAISRPGVTSSDSLYFYWWSPVDSLLHEGMRNIGDDHGAMLTSKVVCFAASADTALLRIDTLTVKTAQGVHVTMSTAAAMQNRGAL
jgi:Tfp pilus assembly protein PilW